MNFVTVTCTVHLIIYPSISSPPSGRLNGIFSYFKCRAIAPDELQQWNDFPVVHATRNGREWDPYNEIYAEEEASFLNHRSELNDNRLPSRRERPHLIEDDEDLRWRMSDVQNTCVEGLTIQEYMI